MVQAERERERGGGTDVANQPGIPEPPNLFAVRVGQTDQSRCLPWPREDLDPDLDASVLQDSHSLAAKRRLLYLPPHKKRRVGVIDRDLLLLESLILLAQFTLPLER